MLGSRRRRREGCDGETVDTPHRWVERSPSDGEVTEKQAREVFVIRVMPKLYEDARQQLAACLTEPDDRVTASMKDTIYEALCLDNDLRANRMVAADRAFVPATMH
jgi:hypothetical protein